MFLSDSLRHWNVLVSPGQPLETQLRGSRDRVLLLLLGLWSHTGSCYQQFTSKCHNVARGRNKPPSRPSKRAGNSSLSRFTGMAVTKGNCPGLGVVPGVGLWQPSLLIKYSVIKISFERQEIQMSVVLLLPSDPCGLVLSHLSSTRIENSHCFFWLQKALYSQDSVKHK